MEEGFTRTEKLVGLFLLVMVLVTKITLLVIAQGKGWFQSHKTYLVKFKQGYNLRQGSLVKMFNTEIGKVYKMRIVREEGENQVEVTIKVLTEYADLIRKDSIAEVVSPTIIGSEYLEISAGSPGQRPIPQYETIQSRPRKTLQESLGEFVNEESGRQVRQILTNVAILSDRLKNHEQAWLNAINHIDEIAQSLLKGQGTMGELLVRREYYNKMKNSLVLVDKFLLEAQKVAADLKPVTRNLQTLSKSLNEEVATIRGILKDVKAGTQEFPRLMESAAETTRGGKEVVDAVKANPLIRMGLPKAKTGQPIHVEPRHVR